MTFKRNKAQGFPAFILFLAYCLAATPTVACEPKVIDSLSLQYLNRHYELAAQINASKVMLVLDTGAKTTLITGAVADTLKLPRDNHRSVIRSQGGRSEPTQDAIISEFNLGKMSISRLRVTVDEEPSVNARFEGILGDDVLLRDDVQIDFPHLLITFLDTSECRTERPNWHAPYLTMTATRALGSGRILVNAAVDSHPMRAILDSGANQTVISVTAVSNAGINAMPSSVSSTSLNVDANGIGTATRRDTFESVRIGSEQFHDAPLEVENATFAETDMLIGLDYLKERIIWLSLNGGHVFVVQPSHVATLKSAFDR